MAAGIATMEVYTGEKLFENAANLSGYFENAMHSLKGLPHVTDVRNIGLMAAIEVAMIPGAPLKRTMDIFDRCFEHGVLVRGAGNTLAVAPPLICEKKHIDRIVDVLNKSIQESAKQLK
jgi:beta-alanine--pyruvate transaminase